MCQQRVIPILEYASIVWGDKNNKVLMDSIQVLQNKAANLVLDRTTHSSSTQALLDLNWMNLSTRRLMQRCFLCIILLMTAQVAQARNMSIGIVA